ncbi:MAG: hypothetical protein ACREBF_00225 [Candidatus Micrarchaeales archaeon]
MAKLNYNESQGATRERYQRVMAHFETLQIPAYVFKQIARLSGPHIIIEPDTSDGHQKLIAGAIELGFHRDELKRF